MRGRVSDSHPQWNWVGIPDSTMKFWEYLVLSQLIQLGRPWTSLWRQICSLNMICQFAERPVFQMVGKNRELGVGGVGAEKGFITKKYVHSRGICLQI